MANMKRVKFLRVTSADPCIVLFSFSHIFSLYFERHIQFLGSFFPGFALFAIV